MYFQRFSKSARVNNHEGRQVLWGVGTMILTLVMIAPTLAAQADTSATSTPKRPNILLLFSDQHHAGILGCEGHPDVKTPNLDRLATAGVRFSRAYCQNGVCGPSRASLMTGLYSRTLGVLDNGNGIPQGVSATPLPVHLKQNGYTVACFGKQHLTPAFKTDWWDEAYSTLPDETPSTYWNWIDERGLFDVFLPDWLAEFGDRMPGVSYNYSAPLLARPSKLPPDATMEAYVAQKTIDFLRRQKNAEKPFFCWCSFYRPHQPYTPIRKYFDRYDPATITVPGSLHQPLEQLPPMMQDWRKNEKRPVNLAEAARNERIYRNFLACYYALVSEVDAHIGTILDVLERVGLAENTIVLYTSDHGEFVGHHGMIEKCHQGHSVYEDTLRVPFFVYWKGHTRANLLCKDLVELVDLVPTVLDLVSLPAPEGLPLPGRSLKPTLFEGRPVGRTFAIAENYSQVAVITDRYKLGHWIESPFPNRDFRTFGDMLFDRQTDPLEMNNVNDAPESATIKAQLLEYLKTWERDTPAEGKKAQITAMARRPRR